MRTGRFPWLAVAVATAALAHGQLDPNKTMVVVNGVTVTADNYYRRMERLADVGKLVGGKFAPATPGYLTLEQIINETLMVQLAVEKGVAPTEAEIDAEVKNLTTDEPQKVEGLRKMGITDAEIRYQVRVTLSEYKVQTMGINIAEQQVEDYYKSNPKKFNTPQMYRLRVIVVDSSALADEVDKQLSAGTAFTQVARKNSKDESALLDGFFGEYSAEDLGDKLRPAVEALKKGQTTGWIDSQKVKLKFLLEDVIPAKTVPFDAKTKAAIRQQLMVDRGRVKNDIPALMAEMRKKAKITYQGTPFDSQLKSTFGG
ncbi:MAG: peptidyl-prolyl cis-trans isomerase [Fimbriimonadaceae bacterium]|nr:peptidyl-prolyl cis-trans isomerase [Fimbriimonadaceae bacterium]